MKYQVLLFYKYVTIANPEELKAYSLDLCKRFNLTGRSIVAEEGINYTLEGLVEDTENFVVEFLKDERFSGMQIKRSEGNGTSFPGLSIKIRKEIVGTRFPKEVDPTKKTGTYLKPEELREWYENDKDFVVVDMRNSYEFESGHFDKSIDPGMAASRELPQLIDKIREETKDKTILTVCTGGVRCEKMSAYLLHEGFDNVYQLDGGMHSYMEKYPGKDFKGTLFTFDNRLVMDFGGEREVIGKCKRCGVANEQYQNCANAECNMLFLICGDCMSSEGPGFCSEKCETSHARVVVRVRG
ncbi:MAG: rhodanese-related sulfurtransferase [Candidatus Paceibacterota bacterium]